MRKAYDGQLHGLHPRLRSYHHREALSPSRNPQNRVSDFIPAKRVRRKYKCSRMLSEDRDYPETMSGGWSAQCRLIVIKVGLVRFALRNHESVNKRATVFKAQRRQHFARGIVPRLDLLRNEALWIDGEVATDKSAAAPKRKIVATAGDV